MASNITPITKEELLPTPASILTKGYRFKSLINSGGFAKIYLTSSQKHGYDVACKHFDLTELNISIPGWVEKCLRQELKIFCAVKHPNLMSAYDVEMHEKEAFVFMPYCRIGSVCKIVKSMSFNSSLSYANFHS